MSKIGNPWGNFKYGWNIRVHITVSAYIWMCFPSILERQPERWQVGLESTVEGNKYLIGVETLYVICRWSSMVSSASRLPKTNGSHDSMIQFWVLKMPVLLQSTQPCYNHAPASPGLVTKKIAFPSCRNFGSSTVALFYVGINVSLFFFFCVNGGRHSLSPK